MTKTYLWPILGLLICDGTYAAKSRGIVLENELFRYSISTDGNRIRPTSYYDLKNGRELLDLQAEAPYFEFMLNERLVSADQPLWRHTARNFRKMANGGMEVTSTFEGVGTAHGVTLLLDHQYFPDSRLVRERLRLKASRGETARLTNRNGRNYFVFPQYSLIASSAGNDTVTEIRMASYNREILDNFDPTRTYDNRPERNLAGAHMFHTATIPHTGSDVIFKGPFAVLPTRDYRVVTSYEHASQDYSIIREKANGAGLRQTDMTDANQNVEGDFGFIPTDDDYWFIGTHVRRFPCTITTAQCIRRGGYLDGEAIPTDDYYETVWSTINAVPQAENHLAAIKEYILRHITEHSISRRVNYYYNTWGMQRDAKSEKSELREIFNEKRILQEIDHAAQLDVDVFVLDDGWQQAMGVWEPNTRKLPSGIEALVNRIEEYGMIPGAWVSLLGIDSTSARFREHRDWVIRDVTGQPVAGQWNHPAFDMVGGFYDLLLADHKHLVDLGFRFFKWDAINTFHSDLPGLAHGDTTHSRKDRIDRYNYLMPFYVVRLMRELREYNPEVVVEIDLTEPERAIVGLMPLQEGKLFWMNNGASGYGDYSTLRTKSMRNIINQTGDLLPPEIFTYAEYPHDAAPYYAQRYNVNTTLIAGHGLWGNLSTMKSWQRSAVGALISKSKRVMLHAAGKPLFKQGLIGATPEIYHQVDSTSAYGQVIGFSGSPVEYTHTVRVDTGQLLGVLNHSYKTANGEVALDFQFTMPDDTR
jgi:hypothetical protein